MQYRSEIDGLRAVAVIPVILFHAGFSWFSGGYVGVDIFFVISGYLITSILLKELSQGEFSIINFYERRARRILPALFFVMICCIPFAWVWMAPTQLKEFSQAIFAITIFLSNVLFWKRTDYFAPSAEENPLLHTWSLAVEEQFYIFFPVLLMLMWRSGASRIFFAILVLSIGSLLLSEWASRNYPAANFYLLPTRAWELGAGALCAFIVQKKQSGPSQFLSLLGFTLVVLSIVIFDDSTRFPSLYALVPVLGTMLIVLYGTRGTTIGKILSNRLLVGIGLISFSAYLWHQPLLAFARVRMLSEPPHGLMFSLSVLSLVLAFFSWKYVEQPFRKKTGSILSNRKAVFVFSGLVMGVFASFGLYGHIRNGFDDRVTLPRLLELDLHAREYQQECFDFSLNKLEADGYFCHLGNIKESPEIAVLGDSHALSFLPPLVAMAEEKEASLIFSGVSSCPPIINTFVLRDDYRRRICNLRNGNAHKKIIDLGVDTVVLIARWSNYTFSDIAGSFMYLGSKYDVVDDKKATLDVFKEKLEYTLRYYTENGLNVIVFHQPPVQEKDARSFYNYYYMILDRSFDKYLAEASISKSDHLARYRPVLEVLEEKVSMFSGVQSIDFSDVLCASGKCNIGTPDRSFYLDDNHLSNYGAKAVGASYRGVIFN